MIVHVKTVNVTGVKENIFMSTIDPLLIKKLQDLSAQARPGNPINEKGRGTDSEVSVLALNASPFGKARFGNHNNENPNKSSKVDQAKMATPIFVAEKQVEKAIEPEVQIAQVAQIKKQKPSFPKVSFGDEGESIA